MPLVEIRKWNDLWWRRANANVIITSVLKNDDERGCKATVEIRLWSVSVGKQNTSWTNHSWGILLLCRKRTLNKQKSSKKDECYKWEVLEIGKKNFSDPPRCRRTGRSAESESHDWTRLRKWHLGLLLCARSRPLIKSFFFTFSSLHLIRTGIPKHRVSA